MYIHIDYMSTGNLLYTKLTYPRESLSKQKWRQWGFCSSNWGREGGRVGGVTLPLFLLLVMLLGEVNYSSLI